VLGLKRALPKNVTQLALSTQYSQLGRTLQGTQRIADDTKLEQSSVSLLTRHHFGEGWAADLRIPTSVTTLSSSSQDQRRVSGLGDMQIGARYDFMALWGSRLGLPSLTLRLALGLPTGTRSSIAIGNEVQATALATGSGAFQGEAQLRLTQFLHRRFALVAPLRARQPLSRINNGRTLARSLAAGIASLVIPTDWLILQAGTELEHRGYEQDVVMGTIINSGGHTLTAQASAAIRFGKKLTWTLAGQGPIYAKLNGRQLTSSFGLSTSLVLRLGADDDEEEHQHSTDCDHAPNTVDPKPEEAPPNETARNEDKAVADFRDAANGGASFSESKIVVMGKLTVVDFWAPWCKRCKVLGRELRELAAQEPLLAVRRVEAPEVDSPVVEEHLGGDLRLPELWIYDASGKRISKLRRMSPAQLMAEVRRSLARIKSTQKPQPDPQR
jgi:thiol-disulfide isomerase/thioredoxin